MKQFFNILIFILSFIWQLPQNIVALCMMPFLGKLTLISKKHLNYCFTGTKMQGGISLGNFSFVSVREGTRETSVMHEQCGHVKQSLLLGPLYLFIIGIPSILHTFHKDCPCYYHFFSESWANKWAGLEVEEIRGGYCRLKKKNSVSC